jgi:hypothetical protein
MAKRAPNPRQQLALVERLHDVVVGAEKEPGDPVVRLRPVTREEDDRDVVAEPFPKLAADLVAAHFGKVDLEQDERRLNLPRRLQSLAPIPRLPRFVAHALEQIRDLTATTGVAIDDENQADRASLLRSLGHLRSSALRQ